MKIICFIISLLVFQQVNATDTLTLGRAVELALSHNLDLQIASIESAQASNSNHPGNAGMLPSVSLNVSEQPSLTNLNQKFTNGTEIARNNVFSHALNAGILFSYTLYDGKKMFAARRRLETAEQAGVHALNAGMLRVISNVHVSYSDIVRQSAYMEVLEKLLAFSKKRLELINVRYNLGMANLTDLYLAELDIETHTQNIAAQQAKIKNAYTVLNLILNLKADSLYPVMKTIPLGAMPAKQSLDSMLSHNPEVLFSDAQYRIALETQREIEAARLPLLRLNASYNYNLSQSQAGFSLFNQVSGPQAGLSLTMPLYSGGVNRSNIENAKLSGKISEIESEQKEQEIRGLFEQNWQVYQYALIQLTSGEKSVKLAAEYITLMQERFRLSQSTILELQEAQRVYEETFYRYINSLYIVKLSETQLLALSGQLLRKE